MQAGIFHSLVCAPGPAALLNPSREALWTCLRYGAVSKKPSNARNMQNHFICKATRDAVLMISKNGSEGFQWGE